MANKTLNLTGKTMRVCVKASADIINQKVIDKWGNGKQALPRQSYA
jgi:predicted ester cyclase